MADANLAFEALIRPYRESGESLESIASRLGAGQIVEEPLLVDGAIVFDGRDHLVVKINSTRSRERRRFTLAHEIGHLMLSTIRRAEPNCSNDRELESACDAIAAELLMPMRDAVELVKQQGSPSLEGLRRIAASFGVSLQTAARRVTKDLALWKGAIGLWEFDSSVRQVWMVGRRFWKDRTPQFAAFRYALNTPEVVKTRESFVEGDVVVPVRLEMMHLGQHRILGLVAQ